MAQRAGFASVDTLQRAFLKRVRITPGQYRERFGPVGGLAAGPGA